MKLSLHLSACLLLGIFLAWPGLMRSQCLITLPHHHLKIADTPGTVIWTRITNTTKHSIILHPLLSNGCSADSASLISGFLGRLRPSADTDEIRLQLIQMVGRYIKSANKTNGLSIFKESDDTVVNRKFSFTGSALSIPLWQCGDFCREAAFILYATGFFHPDDFLLNSFGFHTVMQIKLLGGDTVFADMSVEEPVFMVANAAKGSGWASLCDIINDRSLITDKSKYCYKKEAGDSMDLSLLEISAYKSKFDLPFNQRIFHLARFHPVNFNADFVLYPGQVIEYRDTTGYLVDTGKNGKGQAARRIMQLAAGELARGKMDKSIGAIAESILAYYDLCARLLDTSREAAMAMCKNREIQLFDSGSNWYPVHTTKILVLRSNIPPGVDTLYFGIQTSAPLLIAQSVEINGKDTSLFRAAFYSSSLFSPAHALAAGQVNYANGIGRFDCILPHTRLQQDLLYNNNVLNFYTGGRMFTASGPGIEVSSSADTGR